MCANLCMGCKTRIYIKQPGLQEVVDITRIDPQLKSFQDHFEFRLRQYERIKAAIDSSEGSLEQFAEAGYTFSVLHIGH